MVHRLWTRKSKNCKYSIGRCYIIRLLYFLFRYTKHVIPHDYLVTFSPLTVNVILPGILLIVVVQVTGPLYGWGKYEYMEGKKLHSYSKFRPRIIPWYGSIATDFNWSTLKKHILSIFLTFPNVCVWNKCFSNPSNRTITWPMSPMSFRNLNHWRHLI